MLDHSGGKLSQLDKKASFHFSLLNGQAGIDANDRREMDETRRTKPKTIVVVFAGGRQTGDKSVRTQRHCQRGVWFPFGGMAAVRERAPAWREAGENVCRMSSGRLIFEGLLM